MAEKVRMNGERCREVGHPSGPHERAGHSHLARAEPADQATRRPSDCDRGEGPGHEGETRVEYRVAPHAREEQDVAERVRIEAGGHHDGDAVWNSESSSAHEREVDQRVSVSVRAQHERRSEGDRESKRGDDARARPAPFRSLDYRQDKRADRKRQHETAEQVWHAPATG